eukprot:4421034-Prymnesium_polylepis.1
MNAKVDAVNAKVEEKVDAVNAKVEEKVDAVNAKVEEMNAKLGQILEALATFKPVEASEVVVAEM